MVNVLRALWLLIRSSKLATSIVELAGAAAIVYGADLQWGRGVAWLLAGIALILKAYDLDLNRAPTED